MPFNDTNVIEKNVRYRGRRNYYIRGRGRGRYHEKSGTNTFEQGNFYGRSRGRGRGLGLGRGCVHIYERNLFAPRNDNFKQVQKHYSTCNRCGMTEHWRRTCRTANHLVDLSSFPKTKKKGRKQIL